MSQAKVERYKEQKANRKEIMKKEKRAKVLRNTLTGIVLVAVLGWVGYSGVTYYIAHRPRPTAEVNYTSVADYVESLTAEKPEETTTENATEDTTTTENTAE